MNATRYFPLIGRILIGLPFAMSGLGKLAAFGQTTAMIAAAGLPVPPLAYLVAVVLELGGGDRVAQELTLQDLVQLRFVLVLVLRRLRALEVTLPESVRLEVPEGKLWMIDPTAWTELLQEFR